jgi:hypothetical protein
MPPYLTLLLVILSLKSSLAKGSPVDLGLMLRIATQESSQEDSIARMLKRRRRHCEIEGRCRVRVRVRDRYMFREGALVHARDERSISSSSKTTCS